jgi:hypothetical protein
MSAALVPAPRPPFPVRSHLVPQELKRIGCPPKDPGFA